MKKAVSIIVTASIMALVFVNIATAGTVMDRILKRGELIVGTSANQPPLIAKTKAGKIIGFDADLAQAMARNMGVKIKLVPMPFSSLLPALEAGKVDMVLSGMTMTSKRNTKVAFVGPYFASGKGVLTNKKNVAALQDAEGLNRASYKVAALRGSTSEAFVKQAAPLAKLVPSKSYDDAISQLLQGKVDALVADFPACAVWAFRHSEKGLVAGGNKLTFEPLGIALPEDTLLINWVQNFMIMVKGTGALKELTKKWFENAAWVSELP